MFIILKTFIQYSILCSKTRRSAKSKRSALATERQTLEGLTLSVTNTLVAPNYIIKLYIEKAMLLHIYHQIIVNI